MQQERLPVGSLNQEKSLGDNHGLLHKYSGVSMATQGQGSVLFTELSGQNNGGKNAGKKKKNNEATASKGWKAAICFFVFRLRYALKACWYISHLCCFWTPAPFPLVVRCHLWGTGVI